MICIYLHFLYILYIQKYNSNILVFYLSHLFKLQLQIDLLHLNLFNSHKFNYILYSKKNYYIYLKDKIKHIQKPFQNCHNSFLKLKDYHISSKFVNYYIKYNFEYNQYTYYYSFNLQIRIDLF